MPIDLLAHPLGSGYAQGRLHVMLLTNKRQTHMKLSQIILLAGMLILVAGAVMSMLDIEPYADYVLITGAVVVIIRGFIRNHEK